MRALVFLCLLLAGGGAWAASPWAEFEAPYAIRVAPDGDAVELFGSFSWAVPQNVSAALARAPSARVLRLDSPGGHVQAAIEVAAMIKARGLDTEVARSCASACTIAFLAGKHRILAPDARLGFHQAHAPGVPPAAFDSRLRAVYGTFGLPGAFIDHVLRTPPESIWVPTHAELLAAGAMTAEAATVAVRQNDPLRLAWAPSPRLLHAASDPTVEQFADAFAAVLDQVQAASPEACWNLAHNVAVDIRPMLDKQTVNALTAIDNRLRQEVPDPAPFFIDTAAQTRAIAALIEAAQRDGQDPVLPALRKDADHAAFCPALHRLLAAAKALPDRQRAGALRALLAGG